MTLQVVENPWTLITICTHRNSKRSILNFAAIIRRVIFERRCRHDPPTKMSMVVLSTSDGNDQVALVPSLANRITLRA
jgi:hypothetical protein